MESVLSPLQSEVYSGRSPIFYNDTEHVRVVAVEKRVYAVISWGDIKPDGNNRGKDEAGRLNRAPSLTIVSQEACWLMHETGFGCNSTPSASTARMVGLTAQLTSCHKTWPAIHQLQSLKPRRLHLCSLGLNLSPHRVRTPFRHPRPTNWHISCLRLAYLRVACGQC